MSMRTFISLLFASSIMAFAYGPEKPEWYAVNDDVMGGVSKGGPVEAEGPLLLFVGDISLKNNGGFSSVRADSSDWALPGDGTLVLKLKGDGRSYWMDLRSSRRQGAFSYRLGFQTLADKEVTIRMPLASFRASAFGKNIPLAGALDPRKITSLGFTVFDKKDGPFRLEILDIRFESATASEP